MFGGTQNVFGCNYTQYYSGFIEKKLHLLLIVFFVGFFWTISRTKEQSVEEFIEISEIQSLKVTRLKSDL
jgi:hypothetical protein